MTDIKPYAHDDEPEAIDRSVAVILAVSAANAATEPGLLQPLLPSTTLWELALTCLERLDEPEELAVWAEDAALLEHVDRRGLSRARLLAAPPDRALARGARHALRSANALLLDARHPFLRASTIDEAVRLFRMRTDLRALTSCVRCHGHLFDLHGNVVAGTEPSGSDHPFLRQAGAFSITPAETITLGKQIGAPPAPFEISPSEAFRADAPFPFQLASAYLTSSQT